MNKFYTLANTYNDPLKKKWWEKIFRPKEKWEFDPVLLPDEDGCPPYIGVFYSGDLSKANVERVKGECIRGRIDSSQLKLGSKYNIIYGDPIVIKDMVYTERRDTYQSFSIFYIFQSIWDLNGKHVEVWVETKVDVKISEVV